MFLPLCLLMILAVAASVSAVAAGFGGHWPVLGLVAEGVFNGPLANSQATP